MILLLNISCFKDNNDNPETFVNADLRAKVTRDAYDFFKNYHKNASETTSAVSIDGYKGTTYTLNINNDVRFKRTEYEDIGHDIASFPFKDTYLIEWLFKQNL